MSKTGLDISRESLFSVGAKRKDLSLERISVIEYPNPGMHLAF